MSNLVKKVAKAIVGDASRIGRIDPEKAASAAIAVVLRDLIDYVTASEPKQQCYDDELFVASIRIYAQDIGIEP